MARVATVVMLGVVDGAVVMAVVTAVDAMVMVAVVAEDEVVVLGVDVPVVS